MNSTEATTLTLRADASLGTPYAATFTGPAPELREQPAGVEVQSGLSHVDLSLPQPKGTVRFHVSGGASGLTLRRPAREPA